MKHCPANKATFQLSVATDRWAASCHQNHPFFPWQRFDVLAFVRSGGGIENLDDLDVLQTVADLQTPLIAAVGHVEEKLFIKQIAGKKAPTPNGLGHYFSDMVEQVSEKKTRSRAVLTEQNKKQLSELKSKSGGTNIGAIIAAVIITAAITAIICLLTF